jgi:DNA-binding transcriptional regulator YhcF (GntR family)
MFKPSTIIKLSNAVNEKMQSRSGTVNERDLSVRGLAYDAGISLRTLHKYWKAIENEEAVLLQCKRTSVTLWYKITALEIEGIRAFNVQRVKGI